MRYYKTKNCFSDGYSIDWYIGSDGWGPRLWDVKDDYKVKEFSLAHRRAVFCNDSKTLLLKAGGHFEKRIRLKGPITVGTLLDKCEEYYNTLLTAQEKEYLKANDELSSWNKRIYPNYDALFEDIQTYGDLQGNTVAFACFHIQSDDSTIVTPWFDS